MNIYSSLGQIHAEHLSEAQSLETRLKYCILYRGAFPEGKERALLHLVELVCLRYHGRKGIVDEYDHLAHLMASLSNWLFEHFPLQTAGKDVLSVLARRQWADASKMLPVEVKGIFERAPIFGNARQMSAWRNELMGHLDAAAAYRPLFACEPEGEEVTRKLWWLERLCLSALFSVEPLYDISGKARHYYSQQPNPSSFDKIALYILTEEPFFELIRNEYCRPESLWFPVHLQLVLHDELLDELMVIRYAQHLGEKSSFLLFDYLLRCKRYGEQVTCILTASLALRTQTDREGLLDRIAALNLPRLHEQLWLTWESFNK